MLRLFNRNIPEITKEISQGEYETIFSINIWSRYDEDRELYEMMQFCKYINAIGLAEYVTELFYDSKTSICHIQLAALDKNLNFKFELEAIKTVAILTIQQFMLNGIIGEHNPYLSSKIKFVI